MHIHILGICGTFMGSLAILAREAGHRVTGSDLNVYPPMSTQLEAEGIELIQGYDPVQLNPVPDLVIVGNAISRGNPCVEYMLEQGMPYTSGPQWLHDQILPNRWVMAVAGTHGKTTTSTMLAWILEQAGMSPGFLIGGVPQGFERSARLGSTPFFVIEADEYDTAFFDKRSKFVHYQPRTLIMNNLEFDHADIFPDLASIQRQFHHVNRLVPASGQVIYPSGVKALDEVIAMGCWGQQVKTGLSNQSEWTAELLVKDGSEFEVLHHGESAGVVSWSLTGEHNVMNGLNALVAARHVGVLPAQAIKALSQFAGVKRRMELLGEVRGVKVYDDFAHHPTAIETTLQGLRAAVGNAPIIAVIEPRSNTMRLGMHQQRLVDCTQTADEILWYQPAGMDWSLSAIAEKSERPAHVFDKVEQLVQTLVSKVQPDTHIVVMSNGGFAGIHQKLLSALRAN